MARPELLAGRLDAAMERFGALSLDDQRTHHQHHALFLHQQHQQQQQQLCPGSSGSVSSSGANFVPAMSLEQPMWQPANSGAQHAQSGGSSSVGGSSSSSSSNGSQCGRCGMAAGQHGAGPQIAACRHCGAPLPLPAGAQAQAALAAAPAAAGASRLYTQAEVEGMMAEITSLRAENTHLCQMVRTAETTNRALMAQAEKVSQLEEKLKAAEFNNYALSVHLARFNEPYLGGRLN